MAKSSEGSSLSQGSDLRRFQFLILLEKPFRSLAQLSQRDLSYVGNPRLRITVVLLRYPPPTTPTLSVCHSTLFINHDTAYATTCHIIINCAQKKKNGGLVMLVP